MEISLFKFEQKIGMVPQDLISGLIEQGTQKGF
jgi:hypothetical protein